MLKKIKEIVDIKEFILSISFLIVMLFIILWTSCTVSFTSVKGNNNDVEEIFKQDIKPKSDVDRGLKFNIDKDTIKKLDNGKIY
jgi:hypothetical protein